MKELTRLRESRGLTRATLGAKAKVHPARIGAIELGRIVPPSESVELRRIARTLGFRGSPAGLLEEVSDCASNTATENHA